MMTFMPVVDALRLSLSDVVIDQRDQAAVELAYGLARALDAGGDVEKLAPKLQALLESLLLTPRARAAVTKGAPSGEQLTSPIDELRRRRRARGATTVDPTDTGTDT